MSIKNAESVTNDYDLFLFDLDGTLITSYMETLGKEYHVWYILPGRLEALKFLKESGKEIAVVTNQAGLAYGYVEEADWYRKAMKVGSIVGLPWESLFYVCFGHPNGTVKGVTYQWDDTRRKPSGVMLLEAMADARIAKARTCMVGDMRTDEEAAQAAGVDYFDVKDFFGA